jgi:hypothetical protein
MRLFFIISSFLFAAGCAGSRPTPPDPGSPLAPLGGLGLGEPVRVELLSHETFQGKWAGSRGDTLLLTVETGERRARLAEISRFWVQGRSSKQYALRGAMIGGTVAALGSLWAASASGEQTGEHLDLVGGLGAVLGMGFLGALAAGIPGALLGAGVPRWELRYPIPAPPAKKAVPPRRSLRPPGHRW